jgi:hypothetical protein
MATKKIKKAASTAKAGKVRILAPGPSNPTAGAIAPLNVTVGGPDGSGNPADYPLAPGGSKTAPIDLTQSLPAGTRINSVWHVVIENIVDYAKFKTIRVDQASDTGVTFNLLLGNFQPAGRVRIRIHATYVPV